MAGEQLGMVALLHDLPVVDVADLIRILDRGQAVRDDEAREIGRASCRERVSSPV